MAGSKQLGSRHAAANARRREVTDFIVDDAATDRQLGLAGEVIGRVNGAGQLAYVGAENDPNQSFNGYAPPQQRFAGAAAPAANRVTFRDPSQGTFETGNPDNILDDPVQRLLAEKLRRRR
jgi:hypothetical protein